MKRLILTGILLTGIACSSSYAQSKSGYDDDIYYTSKDAKKDAEQQKKIDEEYERQKAAQEARDREARANSNTYSSDGSGDDVYIDYDDDSYYANRFNRFGYGSYYRPYWYYDPWYSPYYGGGFGMGYGWGCAPGWSVSVGYGWGYPWYGNYGWGYPYYGGYYGYPYYGYGYPYYGGYYGEGYGGGGYGKNVNYGPRTAMNSMGTRGMGPTRQSLGLGPTRPQLRTSMPTGNGEPMGRDQAMNSNMRGAYQGGANGPRGYNNNSAPVRSSDMNAGRPAEVRTYSSGGANQMPSRGFQQQSSRDNEPSQPARTYESPQQSRSYEQPSRTYEPARSEPTRSWGGNSSGGFGGGSRGGGGGNSGGGGSRGGSFGGRR